MISNQNKRVGKHKTLPKTIRRCSLLWLSYLEFSPKYMFTAFRDVFPQIKGQRRDHQSYPAISLDAIPHNQHHPLPLPLWPYFPTVHFARRSISRVVCFQNRQLTPLIVFLCFAYMYLKLFVVSFFVTACLYNLSLFVLKC